MPSPQAICDILWSVAAAMALGGAAFGLGRPVLRRLNLPPAEFLFVAVWSVALGLVCGGSLLLALAAAGCIYAPVIVGITLAANFWTLVEFTCIYLGAGVGQIVSPGSATEPSPSTSAPRRGSLFVALLAALVLLLSLVVALAPTTSREVISGSLELPKELLLEHGLSGGLYVGSAPPNLIQMWYVCALALDGPVAAALVYWGIGLLLALATVLVAQEFLPSGHARLAGCLVLLCPGVQYQLSLPLADLGLALFCALALAAVARIVVHLETTRWPIAGGVMLGGAIAAMPAGLAFAGALGIVGAYVCGSPGESRREFSEAARTFLVATLLTAAPWLFFLGFFLNHSGSTQSLHSVAAHLGPWMLLALGLLLATRRLRGLGLVLGVASAYAVLSLASPWPGRWWSPLIPPAAIVAAWVWHETARLPRVATAIISVAAALLTLIPSIALWTDAGDLLPVATGWQRRDDFLLARDPTYRAALMLNRIQGSNDRLWCEDSAGSCVASTFYFNCPSARRALAPDSPATLPANQAHADWSHAAQAGFTYLLLADTVDAASSACVERHLPCSLASSMSGSHDEFGPIGQVIPILEYRFADDNNRPIRYRLLRMAKSRR